MFIPLGTDRPLRRPTLVNHALIGVCALVYVADLLLTRSNMASAEAVRVFDGLALDPRQPRWWTFVTYQFLHGSPWHLGGNMLFLWVFGPNVEDRLGRVGHLAFYLVGGVAAGLLHVLMSDASVVGASGSISAVTGAYLVLFPRTTIRVLVFFLIIGVWQIPAAWFIGASIAWDLFLPRSGVAIAAHMGGYLYGIAITLSLLATGVLKRETFDLFSIARQAKRRRDFKAATSGGATPWRGQPSTRLRRERADPAESAREEAVGRARAEVVALLDRRDPDGAALAYKRALDEHGRFTLPRASQLDLANHFFAQSDHSAAAVAYEVFLEKHPRDAESPRVRLMLGLVNARYLNDPVRAKSLLREARDRLASGPERALADELLAELG